MLIRIYQKQISKIIQLGGFLGRLVGPLMKVDLPFMKMYLNHCLKVF